ncbi:MAG: AAA family ATPase [Clostridium sp.]
MIIWINGAFGSGKSTTAELLKLKIENSHIYDPEQVGYFLWDNFPVEMKEKGDFQDMKIWRSINYQIIKHMYDNYSGVIIIPMTITNQEYYEDIIGNLIKDKVKIYHFILTADKTTIKQRLINRGECENSWAELQIDRCLQAFESTIKGRKINTNNLSTKQVVDVILKNLDIQ